MRTVDTDRVTARLSRGGQPHTGEAGESSVSGGRTDSEDPLWPTLLMAAMAVLGVEMMLLGVWRR